MQPFFEEPVKGCASGMKNDCEPCGGDGSADCESIRMELM